MQVRRPSKRSSYVFATILIAALMGMVAGYALGGNPTFQTIIQPGSQVQACGVTVFTDGATSFTRNGKTGEVISRASATVAIQAGIDTVLGTSGGSLCIQAGSYSVGNVHLASKVAILGSPGTILNGAAFNISAASDVAIQGLTIRSSTSAAIYISTWSDSQHNRNIRVSDNVITNSADHAIEIIGYTSSSPRGFTTNVTIANNHLYYPGSAASSFSTGILVENAKSENGPIATISGNTVEYAWESGIHIEGALGAVLVTNNYVDHSGRKPGAFYGAGILMAYSSDVQAMGNRLTNNLWGMRISGVVDLPVNASYNVYGNSIQYNERGVLFTGNQCTPVTLCSVNTIFAFNDVLNTTHAGILMDTKIYGASATFFNSVAIQGNRLMDNNPLVLNDGIYGSCADFIFIRQSYAGFSNSSISINGNTIGYTKTGYHNPPLCLNGDFQSMTILGNTAVGFSGFGINLIQILSNRTPILVARSNSLFNPVGNISATAFDITNRTIGLKGYTGVLPSNAFYNYRVTSVDLLINVEGGSGVTVTIKDTNALVIFSASSLSGYWLPIGYFFNIQYSSAPDIFVYGN